MAGGAGSGKSYISELIFMNKLSPYGTKLINSDEFFEIALKKRGLPMTIDPSIVNIYSQQMDARAWAKDLTTTKQKYAINGMLPLIIDGTGRDFTKIKKQAEDLKSIGYDVSMIFVNTSLSVAKMRNEKRDRKVDPALVESMWYAVQDNLGKFQQYFGNKHFYIIDNNVYFEPQSTEEKSFKTMLYKLGNKLITSPLQNPVGKSVIQFMNKNGLKYLSDLVEEK
jgi:predicted kinase